MSFSRESTHNVCVGRLYQDRPPKRVFTQIGVGWEQPNGAIKLRLDVTVVLGPAEELWLFPKADGRLAVDEGAWNG
jgi:hypothetical protein